MKKPLTDFCFHANQEIFQFYEERNSCIFSTAVVCDVLTHLGLKAEPLRVEVHVFPDQGKMAFTLGWDGDGTRRPASEPGSWGGHLVSLVENNYLVDTTLDQLAVPNITPVVIYLPETKWFEDKDYSWTGNLRLFAHCCLRYQKYHQQRDWKSAGDFRPRRRQHLVQQLVISSFPIFHKTHITGGRDIGNSFQNRSISFYEKPQP